MNCYRKTTGIHTLHFDYNNEAYTLIDVGGQRHARMSWIYCYERASLIFYTVAISEYDQICYEDNETSRSEESLILFDEVINNAYFRNSKIILLLNKVDLFNKKIKSGIKLSNTFKDYDGGSDTVKAQNFMKNKYLSVNKFDPDRVFPFIINSLDKDCIKKVVEDVIVLFENNEIKK